MKQTAHSQKQTKAALKTLAPRCGDCSGLKREQLIPGSKSVCSQNGIITTSKTCSHFMSEIEPIKPLVGTRPFEQLLALIAEVPDNALRSLGGLLFQEAKTRKFGFYFGQKVYVRYRGQANRNYMSNFLSAVVFSANAAVIRLTSDDGRCTMTFTLDVVRAGGVIYTTEEFEPLREEMVANGKHVDPNAEKLVAKRMRCEELKRIQDIIDNAESKIKAGTIEPIGAVFKRHDWPMEKRRAKEFDLVAIVESLSEGGMVHNPNRLGGYVRPDSTKKSKRKNKDSVVNVSGDL